MVGADDWVVYGTVDGDAAVHRQAFDTRTRCVLRAPRSGACGWITVQGKGRMGKLDLQTPTMIRFGTETEDEVFITHEAANRGVEVTNTGSEPLEGLRYFGPDTFSEVPEVGSYTES